MENNKKIREVVVKYNNNVINDETTNIIVKQFIDAKTSQNVALFVLEYNMEEKPVQIVLGKLQFNKGDTDLSKKAKVIQEYLINQLKKNAKEPNDFQYCSDLDRICVKKSIPFVYTDEGIKILTNNRNEDIPLKKTYGLNEEHGFLNLICYSPDKIMDKYASEFNLRKNIKERVSQNRAINAAKRELKPEQLNLFKLGRKIKEFKAEQNKDIVYSFREALTVYLIKEKLRKHKEKNSNEQNKMSLDEWLKIKNYYKEKENRDVKIDPSMMFGLSEEQSLEERFFRIKEKAIAIDIKRILENEQNAYVEKNMDSDVNVEENDNDEYSLINSYKTMFDFVKDGRDGNVRFSYSRTKDGFKNLKSIVKKQDMENDEQDINSKEILKYLELKENLLKNVNNRGKGFYEMYNKNNDVKKFVEFVIASSARNYTMEDEKDIFLDIYNDMVDEMISRHKDSVELYNGYASRFGAETCQIPVPISVESIEKGKHKGEYR